MINAGIVTVSYIIATILFILALGGLSNQASYSPLNTPSYSWRCLSAAASACLRPRVCK
jgi:NAD/NADP transhydrogenase beta subunit